MFCRQAFSVASCDIYQKLKALDKYYTNSFIQSYELSMEGEVN